MKVGFWSVVGLAFCLGCGDDGASGGGPASGGGGDGGAGAETPAGGGGQGTGGGGAPAEGSRIASVQLFLTTLPGFVDVSALADFYELTGDLGCTVTSLDECVVSECLVVNGQSPIQTRFAAGTVTIAGGNGPDVVLEPDQDNQYSVASSIPDDYLAGGRALTVQVEGSVDIPGYSLSVEAAPQLTVTSSPPTLIDRQEAQTFTWTNGGDEVLAFVTSSEPQGVDESRVVTTFCTFDGSSSSGTVPSEALSLLAPTTGQATGSVSLLTRNVSSETVDGVTRSFVTNANAVDPDGANFGGLVAIE